MQNIFFISGIDTDAGKTVATGWLAREWLRAGTRVITQKLVQTGNSGGVSEDILRHREIMGCGLLPEDREGLTAPALFPFPASPHLASKLAGREIDFVKIDLATRTLAERYGAVLVEGAGGLMVPLAEDYLTIDFIRERAYPVIFVSSAKLGSINHTLLSLEALKTRGMLLHSLLFNGFPESDPAIGADTERFLRGVIARDWPGTEFLKVPVL